MSRKPFALSVAGVPARAPSKGRWTALGFAAALLIPATGHAELYSFVDEHGVLHFTNLPDDPRYRPHKLGDNTFQWTDDLGALRRVHRVDVRTYDLLIAEAAAYYALPASLLKSIIAVESSFEPRAVSARGAQGLMQLLGDTASAMYVTDVFSPRDNVFGGARYLRVLANRFRGDLRLTIAAYNAGPDAVEKFGGVPPFRETQTYVQRVLRVYRHYLAGD